MLFPARTFVVLASLALSVFSAAHACVPGADTLGVSRIVEVDAEDGPVFGSITKQRHERRFLAPKEVILTFDDGPMPGVTRQILDTLDRFCTKATFFSVGRMAIAYPANVRDILKRGHTLGTHTWSHPMSLPRLSVERAKDQIESGFAAVALAAGQPIAPFFRFPGLNDSAALVSHLKSRGIATFSVDVVSNDSYIQDPQRLIARTLSQLEAENGGIALFHDIKPQTARALPTLLAEMKARGYKIVHMRSKQPFKPLEPYLAAVREDGVFRRSPTPGMPALIAVTDMNAAAPRAAGVDASQSASTPPMIVAAATPVAADGARGEAAKPPGASPLAEARRAGAADASDANGGGTPSRMGSFAVLPVQAVQAPSPSALRDPLPASEPAQSAQKAEPPVVTVVAAAAPARLGADEVVADERPKKAPRKPETKASTKAPGTPVARRPQKIEVPLVIAAPASTQKPTTVPSVAGNYSVAGVAKAPVAPKAPNWIEAYQDRSHNNGN